MVDQCVIEDMVDYIIKLEKEMNRQGLHPSVQMMLLGFFVFHQFNSTRNDTKREFDRLIKALQNKEKKDDPNK